FDLPVVDIEERFKICLLVTSSIAQCLRIRVVGLKLKSPADRMSHFQLQSVVGTVAEIRGEIPALSQRAGVEVKVSVVPTDLVLIRKFTDLAGLNQAQDCSVGQKAASRQLRKERQRLASLDDRVEPRIERCAGFLRQEPVVLGIDEVRKELVDK